MEELEKIKPLKLSRSNAIKVGKFAAKIKKMSGINLELWDSYQPERLSPETAQADAIVRPVDINETTELSRND